MDSLFPSVSDISEYGDVIPMRAEDKFGNPIYLHVFKKLVAIGSKLEQIGYRESFRKPNLFLYAYPLVETPTGDFEVVCFADMRGTDIVKIWHDPVPMFYILSKNSPEWIFNRFTELETTRLDKAGIPYRFSFFAMHEPGPVKISKQLNDALQSDERMKLVSFQLTGMGEDGFCKVCGHDILDEGLWCSEKCASKLVDTRIQSFYDSLTRCKACNCHLNWRVPDKELLQRLNLPVIRKPIDHHIDYANNITVPVCVSCHPRIPRDESLAHLRPVDERPRPSRMYKMVPCVDCDGKARVGISEDVESSVCYKCKQKRMRKSPQPRRSSRGAREHH